VRRIDHVMADVIFEKLGRQSVHSPTNRSDQHQHVGAAELGFQRALDRLDLSLDATDTAGELGFVLDRVHENNIRGYPILIKSRLVLPRVRIVRSGPMKPTLTQKGLLLFVAVLWTESAKAHGIAGNRYFDGTMTFDDPAVADEAIVPNFSYLGYPTQGSNVLENRINWAFARLLTPTLAVTLDSGWIHQNWPIGHTSGFDKTNLGLKYEAYRDNKHEALVSVSLAWGIAYSGSIGVGTDAPNTIQPGVTFGKGFGDLPDSLSWLRPFAITGSVVDEEPVGSGGRALVPNLATGASRLFLRRPSKRCIGASRFNTARSI
jgi:hypothetical protein